jgi:hypothetical protein
MTDGGKLCKLYKAVDGKRSEVARFVGKDTRDRSGVVLIDEESVDEVVALVTLAATLNRVESFRI